jgi:hypothetical protein
VLARDDQVLDVEDDLDDVFLHPGDRRELVLDVVDPDAGDSGAGIEDSRVRRRELPRV